MKVTFTNEPVDVRDPASGQTRKGTQECITIDAGDPNNIVHRRAEEADRVRYARQYAEFKGDKPKAAAAPPAEPPPAAE